MESWSDRYIGLKSLPKGRTFAGVDCWGIGCLAYLHELGIVLPSYDDAYAGLEERAEIAAALAAGSSSYPWTRMPEGDVLPFDLVMFMRAGIYDHVGVVVDRGIMLHIEEGRESCIAAYDAAPWRTRLIGIYRHAEMMP